MTAPAGIPEPTPPTRRFPWIPVAIGVNVLAIVAAVITVVSMNSAVAASVPPTRSDEQLAADLRLTPLDVKDVVLGFAQQAVLVTDAGGTVRSQTAGMLAPTAAHEGSHECMGLLSPSIDGEHAWSTRGVWLESETKGELAITTGVEIFATAEAAGEAFDVVVAIADQCASDELKVSDAGSVSSRTVAVDETTAGGRTLVSRRQLGNVVFFTKTAWVGAADAISLDSVMRKATSPVSDFAKSRLEGLRDDAGSAEHD